MPKHERYRDAPIAQRREPDRDAVPSGDTGVPVPVNNKARKIDSVLATGLETLPGFTGMMAVLAMRNLRRGLALGLPSGQGMASFLAVPKMTTAQLTHADLVILAGVTQP